MDKKIEEDLSDPDTILEDVPEELRIDTDKLIARTAARAIARHERTARERKRNKQRRMSRRANR